MTRQRKLIEDVPDKREPLSMREIEDWINEAPEEWRDPLRYFTTHGLNKRDAMIAAWWSIPKESKKLGKFPTQQKLADWLGLSRQRLSTLEDRKHGDPPRNLRQWGQKARVRHLDEFGPDVDSAMVGQLTDGEASAALFALYYKLTGLLVDETKLHMVGGDKDDGDEPIGIQVIGDYRVAIAGLAPRPVGDRDASGADQDAGDGAPVG